MTSVTIGIPQSAPIDAWTQEAATGALYTVAKGNNPPDILLKNTYNGVTTIISLVNGFVYPTLPSNAFQLPTGSLAVLTV